MRRTYWPGSNRTGSWAARVRTTTAHDGVRQPVQFHDLTVPDAFGEALHPVDGVVVVDDQVAAGLEAAGEHVALLLLGRGQGVDRVVEQLVVVALDQEALAGGAGAFPALGEEDVALAQGGGDDVLVLAALDGEARLALEGELDLVGASSCPLNFASPAAWRSCRRRAPRRPGEIDAPSWMSSSSRRISQRYSGSTSVMRKTSGPQGMSLDGLHALSLRGLLLPGPAGMW